MIGSTARQHHKRRIERALELQLHLVLGVEMERLDADRAADVVDQHVDPAIGGDGLVHQLLRARKRAEIDQHLQRRDAMLVQLSHGLRRALVDAVGDDDGAALRAEPLRRGAADALPRAGDDADLVLQPAPAGRAMIEFSHAVLRSRCAARLRAPSGRRAWLRRTAHRPAARRSPSARAALRPRGPAARRLSAARAPPAAAGAAP